MRQNIKTKLSYQTLGNLIPQTQEQNNTYLVGITKMKVDNINESS